MSPSTYINEFGSIPETKLQAELFDRDSVSTLSWLKEWRNLKYNVTKTSLIVKNTDQKIVWTEHTTSA